jgi:hypothetical protein
MKVYGYKRNLILLEEIIGLVLMKVELEDILLCERAGDESLSE